MALSKVLVLTTTSSSGASGETIIDTADWSIQVTVSASSGDVTAVCTPYVSNDGVGWIALPAITVASGATPQSNGYGVGTKWARVKFVFSALTAGATATVTLGV